MPDPISTLEFIGSLCSIYSSCVQASKLAKKAQIKKAKEEFLNSLDKLNNIRAILSFSNRLREFSAQAISLSKKNPTYLNNEGFFIRVKSLFEILPPVFPLSNVFDSEIFKKYDVNSVVLGDIQKIRVNSLDLERMVSACEQYINKSLHVIYKSARVYNRRYETWMVSPYMAEHVKEFKYYLVVFEHHATMVRQGGGEAFDSGMSILLKIAPEII